MATTLPIVVYKPSSLAMDFYVTDPDTNLPIDLTGATEIAVSVVSLTPPTCVTKLMSTSGVVLVGNAVLGHFQAKFSTSDVASFAITSQDASGAVSDESTLQAVTIKITDPTNPNRNPYILVVQRALAVLAPPC